MVFKFKKLLSLKESLVSQESFLPLAWRILTYDDRPQSDSLAHDPAPICNRACHTQAGTFSTSISDSAQEHNGVCYFGAVSHVHLPLTAGNRCIEPNATACNRTIARLGDADSCVVHDTDIILNFDFGRVIFDYAMRGVIQAAQRKVAFELRRTGDRVLRNDEIPWVTNREGLRITATTPNPGPRLLSWEILQIALKGLMQCGYDDHKYREMFVNVWDMRADFYGELQLLNRPYHAIQ